MNNNPLDTSTKAKAPPRQRLRIRQPLPTNINRKPEEPESALLSRAPANLLCRQQATLPRASVIQTKLTVNEPDDQYEQEAEQVATSVMRMPSTALVAPAPQLEASNVTSYTDMPAIQAQLIARVHAAREEATQEEPTVTPDIENRIQSMNGTGNPLPDSERSFFESRMGADFSGVRIHTGTNAVQMSRDLNARAFTVGNNVAFNAGEYAPGTDGGRHLLAHELTHVVQQGGAGRVQRQSIDNEELEAIRKRYEERTEIYREYYNNPKYDKQEEYFGKAIVNVLIEIKNRLNEFEDANWIDCISDFLQKRWLLGVQGAPAFKAKYGEEALKKYENSVSSDMWEKALQAAQVAETNPEEYDTNKEQRAAISKFPKDIRDAFETLKDGDPVFDDDKEYATYLQTIAHDYIDLSDAMIECGCGSQKDWALLIDILTDESAEGFLAWMGDVSGLADESLENFLTLTIRRATILSLERNKENLVAPDID